MECLGRIAIGLAENLLRLLGWVREVVLLELLPSAIDRIPMLRGSSDAGLLSFHESAQ
jgi:hypothetical protein